MDQREKKMTKRDEIIYKVVTTEKTFFLEQDDVAAGFDAAIAEVRKWAEKYKGFSYKHNIMLVSYEELNNFLDSLSAEEK
jgi:hypothetical protein